MAFDANKYHAEYVKATYRQFIVKVNRNTDPDMVAWLESMDNVQVYLRELVRKDMKRKLARTQTST